MVFSHRECSVWSALGLYRSRRPRVGAVGLYRSRRRSDTRDAMTADDDKADDQPTTAVGDVDATAAVVSDSPRTVVLRPSQYRAPQFVQFRGHFLVGRLGFVPNMCPIGGFANRDRRRVRPGTDTPDAVLKSGRVLPVKSALCLLSE